MAIHTAPRDPAERLERNGRLPIDGPVASADDEDEDELDDGYEHDEHHEDDHHMPDSWDERHAIRLEADHLVEVLGG